MHALGLHLGHEPSVRNLCAQNNGLRRLVAVAICLSPDGQAAYLCCRLMPDGPSEQRGDVLGLDHVQLAAPSGCEEAARRFFGDLIGLVEIDKPPLLQGRGGVWFALGAQQLHIGVAEPFTPAGKAHPALRVTPGRLDQLAERLSAAGAPVRWDEALPQYRRFYTEDPWGNRIELLSTR
jgi:catechol 2,3-dioxygenase-like lactoylglutathione lyase family enzyme